MVYPASSERPFDFFRPYQFVGRIHFTFQEQKYVYVAALTGFTVGIGTVGHHAPVLSTIQLLEFES
jgi:hypothetical protein